MIIIIANAQRLTTFTMSTCALSPYCYHSHRVAVQPIDPPPGTRRRNVPHVHQHIGSVHRCLLKYCLLLLSVIIKFIGSRDRDFIITILHNNINKILHYEIVYS